MAFDHETFEPAALAFKPEATPESIDELMKLLAEKPEGFTVTEDEAEPTEEVTLN